MDTKVVMLMPGSSDTEDSQASVEEADILVRGSDGQPVSLKRYTVELEGAAGAAGKLGSSPGRGQARTVTAPQASGIQIAGEEFVEGLPCDPVLAAVRNRDLARVEHLVGMAGMQPSAAAVQEAQDGGDTQMAALLADYAQPRPTKAGPSLPTPDAGLPWMHDLQQQLDEEGSGEGEEAELGGEAAWLRPAAAAAGAGTTASGKHGRPDSADRRLAAAVDGIHNVLHPEGAHAGMAALTGPEQTRNTQPYTGQAAKSGYGHAGTRTGTGTQATREHTTEEDVQAASLQRVNDEHLSEAAAAISLDEKAKNAGFGMQAAPSRLDSLRHVQAPPNGSQGGWAAAGYKPAHGYEEEPEETFQLTPTVHAAPPGQHIPYHSGSTTDTAGSGHASGSGVPGYTGTGTGLGQEGRTGDGWQQQPADADTMAAVFATPKLGGLLGPTIGKLVQPVDAPVQSPAPIPGGPSHVGITLTSPTGGQRTQLRAALQRGDARRVAHLLEMLDYDVSQDDVEYAVQHGAPQALVDRLIAHVVSRA